MALEVEATALAADPRVKTVEDTMYVDGDGEVFLASTAGVRGSFRAGQCYAFAYVLAEQEGQVETGYSYSVGRAVEDLDPAFVRHGGHRARHAGCSAADEVPVDEGAGHPRPVRLGGVLRRAQLRADRRRRAEEPLAVRRP